MSIVGALSGQNQIAKLTHGASQLPLQPLDKIHLEIIIETLAEAWNNLVLDYSLKIFQEGEEHINRLMVSELNNLRDNGISLWSALVSSVQDASNIPNFDGTRIGKQPYIAITLTNNRPANLPFIVECKLIGPTKGVDLYCKQGLLRFVEGEYAWYDPQSIMIAYVQDDSTIQNKLRPYLKNQQSKSVDPYKTISLPQNGNLLPEMDIAKSTHERHFPVKRNGAVINSGNIALWHLWLKQSNTNDKP